MRNQCQLITYPDSLGKNLKELRYIADRYLQRVIAGIHILPFYPSSADRGFAPLTYFTVDPVFGNWEDIEDLGDKYDLIVDFMINHISRESEYFKNFIKNKNNSDYADLFIRYKDFWPDNRPTEQDIKMIYKRKPLAPYVTIEFNDGTREDIWCTFDKHQIDLNLKSKKTRLLLADFLHFLCSRNIKTIRLDAIGYVTKNPGTSCFFIEPDIWEVLDFVKKITDSYKIELLPEVHEHYSLQLKLAEKGYRVYDFALPMLVLHAIYENNARFLKKWLTICPEKQITTLDTHDGIGLVDIIDLLPENEIKKTRQNLFSKGVNVKPIYNTKKYQNLDIYQINSSYYSALGNNDEAYLIARAIQFYTPGIPQVYYVGLLAGKNDLKLLEETKIGRNINRHYYSLDEVKEEVTRPVVKKLFELMRFRNNYPAFNGNFSILPAKTHELQIEWKKGELKTTLKVDLKLMQMEIDYVDQVTGKSFLL